MLMDEYRLVSMWESILWVSMSFFFPMQCFPAISYSRLMLSVCRNCANRGLWGGAEGSEPPHWAQPTHAARSRRAHFPLPSRTPFNANARAKDVMIHLTQRHSNSPVSVRSYHGIDILQMDPPGWWKAARSAGDKSTPAGPRRGRTPLWLRATQLLFDHNVADFVFPGQ